MNLYRATYETNAGHTRRMTFAAADARQAQRIAAEWEASDDRLKTVAALRPLQAPMFQLRGGVMQ